MFRDNNVVVVCREVNEHTGKIELWKISDGADRALIQKLSTNAIINKKLRYFLILAERWNSGWEKDYIDVLSESKITLQKLNKIGGIIEI